MSLYLVYLLIFVFNAILIEMHYYIFAISSIKLFEAIRLESRN